MHETLTGLSPNRAECVWQMRAKEQQRNFFSTRRSHARSSGSLAFANCGKRGYTDLS